MITQNSKHLALSLAIGASLSLGAFTASAQTLSFSSDWQGTNASSSTYNVLQENQGSNTASFNYNGWNDEVVGYDTQQRAGFAVTPGSGNQFQVDSLYFNAGVKVSQPLAGPAPAGYGDGYSLNWGPSINGDGNQAGQILSPYDVEPQGLTIQVPTYGGNGNNNDALINWDGSLIGRINGITATPNGDWIGYTTTINTLGQLAVNVYNANESFNQTFNYNLTNWGEANSTWGYTVASFAGGAGEINEVGGETITAIPEPSTYALFGLGALALVIAYRRRTA